MKTGIWSDDEHNAAAKLRRQGLTMAEIGKRIGRSRQSVGAHLHRTLGPTKPLPNSAKKETPSIVMADHWMARQRASDRRFVEALIAAGYGRREAA